MSPSSSPGGRRTRRAEGFTLLEVLVAVLVLAAIVGVVPRSLVSARTNLERSKDWLAARLVAETVLNEALVGPSLKAGALGGEVDGHRWRATLRPINAQLSPEAGTDRVLLDVRVEVAASGKATLLVETMRIGTSQ